MCHRPSKFVLYSRLKSLISVHCGHVFLSLSFISSYFLILPLSSLILLTSYSPHCKGFISPYCSGWLQFLLFLLFPMRVFLSVINVYLMFLCGMDHSVFGCTENEWTWSWGWKVKAALMAKSVAIKTTQSGWMLWRPEDNIFLKIREWGEVCQFSSCDCII